MTPETVSCQFVRAQLRTVMADAVRKEKLAAAKKKVHIMQIKHHYNMTISISIMFSKCP